LVLDGVEFPAIKREKIPTSDVRVPLTLHQEKRETTALLIAGWIEIRAIIKEDDEIAVQPASRWWMLPSSYIWTRAGTGENKRRAKDTIKAADIARPLTN